MSPVLRQRLAAQKPMIRLLVVDREETKTVN
jgi:hypothetical protein